MTWNDYEKPIVHEGVTYGSKEMEFVRIEDVPSRTHAACEVAINCPNNDAPLDRLRALGWSVLDGRAVSLTADSYRSYLRGSRAELSVAKNIFVATRCGWFSCRSVCYLAAGRPVVIQNTGFSEAIPTGHGLFAFSDLEEAVQGVEAVERDYAYHSQAARELARSHFDSDQVLGELLHQIGLG